MRWNRQLVCGVSLFGALWLAAGTSSEAAPPAAAVCHLREASRTPVAEIWLDERVIFRLRADLGEYELAERCRIVAARVNTMLRRGAGFDTIAPRRVGRQDVVAYGDQILVTVSRKAAEANRTSTAELARRWANHLREALGQPPLPSPADAAGGTAAWQGASGPPPEAGLYTMKASWYGWRFAGRRTASGEVFDPQDLTVAHRTLPFGTRLRLINPETGAQVVARVNDRGPFVAGRDLDVSLAIADRLDFVSEGVETLLVEVLDG